MAMNVGDVILGLEARLKGFDTAIKEMSAVEAKSKALEKTINNALNASLLTLAGTIGMSVKRFADYSEQIDKIAIQTGMTREAVQELNYAASQEGTTIEQVAMGFKFLAMSMQNSLSGQESYQQLFRELGVSLTDVNGKTRDITSVFYDVADGLNTIEDGTKRTDAIMQLFGRSGIDLNLILKAGSSGLKEYADTARKLGQVISSDTIKQGEAMGDEFSKMQKTLDASMMKIAVEVMPTLSKLADTISTVVSKFNGFSEVIRQGISIALADAQTKLTSFLFSLDKYNVSMKDATANTGSLTTATGLMMKGAFDLGSILFYGTKALMAWTQAQNDSEAATRLMKEQTEDAQKAVEEMIKDKKLDGQVSADQFSLLEKMQIAILYRNLANNQALIEELGIDQDRINTYEMLYAITMNTNEKNNEIKTIKEDIVKLEIDITDELDKQFQLETMKTEATGRSIRSLRTISDNAGKTAESTKMITNTTLDWGMALGAVDSTLSSILDKSQSTGDKWKEILANLLPALGAIIGTLIAPGVGTTVGAGIGSVAGTLVGGLNTGNMSAPININVSSPVFSDTEAVEMTFRRAVRKGITLSNSGAINV